jgi:hypothetical protein
MPGVNGVLAKIGAAVVLKLLCGGDDVVWLAPFLARESKWGKCVVAQKYVAVVAVLCSLAVGLATTVHFATHASAGGKEERVVDKAVACFAGALLLAYAAHLAVEEGRCAGARAVAPEKDAEVESLLRREKRDAAYGAATVEESDEEYEEDLNCCEDAVRLCLESGLRVDEDPEADAARKRFIIVAALGNLLCGIQIFNPTSMCAYATVSTQGLLLCFGNSMRAIDSSKNQPNRLRFDRDREF